jgi:hypothetical protein
MAKVALFSVGVNSVWCGIGGIEFCGWSDISRSRVGELLSVSLTLAQFLAPKWATKCNDFTNCHRHGRPHSNTERATAVTSIRIPDGTSSDSSGGAQYDESDTVALRPSSLPARSTARRSKRAPG